MINNGIIFLKYSTRVVFTNYDSTKELQHHTCYLGFSFVFVFSSLQSLFVWNGPFFPFSHKGRSYSSSIWNCQTLQTLQNYSWGKGIVKQSIFFWKRFGNISSFFFLLFKWINGTHVCPLIMTHEHHEKCIKTVLCFCQKQNIKF